MIKSVYINLIILLDRISCHYYCIVNKTMTSNNNLHNAFHEHKIWKTLWLKDKIIMVEISMLYSVEKELAWFWFVGKTISGHTRLIIRQNFYFSRFLLKAGSWLSRQTKAPGDFLSFIMHNKNGMKRNCAINMIGYTQRQKCKQAANLHL